MTAVEPAAALTPADGSAVVARVIRRIVPFIFCCYVVAYVDRVNIGFAASDLQRDLGLSNWAYGIGGGLFFFGYFLFEVPSNLLLQRVGARIWIARIMIVWGFVSMATVFVRGEWSFYASRVLLGLAEAGFFPGVILYLTFWIPAAYRARAGALFMMAIPISVLIGSPISEALLQLNGRLGLRGWQWLFIGEGLPAIVLGVATLWLLTDKPEQATWLPRAEREWLIAQLERERIEKAKRLQDQAMHGLNSLLNGKVWLLCAIYFLQALGTYGLFLWLPKILSDVSGFKGPKLSAITMVPFVAALAGMILIGQHSDRTGERKWHAAACALTASLGIALAAFSQHSTLLIVLAFTLSQLGQRSILSVFWAIPPMFLGGTAAAASIALINAIGNLGGFVGPALVGWLRTGRDSYTEGLLVLSAALVLQALLIAALRLPARDLVAPAAGAATGSGSRSFATRS
jgi:ACS family tartrate transporter-like MFS transporter